MPNQKFKLHPIHNLFKFNAESRESKCIVSGCRVSLKGKNLTNLIRHAEEKHLEEFIHLMAIHKKKKAQPDTKQEGMQLRSYCEEKTATKWERNKEKGRLYSKAYSIKLKKKQTEDKLKKSSVCDPTSLIIEGLSMQLLHGTTLDPPVPVCPIPMTLAKNSQQQLQPTALDSQQNQTVYPNWQETNRISDFIDNLSSETNNNSNFSSATIPQPSPCSFLKAMSDTTVLLEQNHPEANEIPNGVRIEELPPLVPIYESFQEASFPTDYAPVEIFCQPYPANIPIEDSSLESSTQVVFSPEAQLMFSEQMRKHVQLLTQMHLITAQQSDLKSVTEGCYSMLQDLVPLKQRMEIANLDEALDLVERWETVVTKASSEELRKYQRQVVNCGEKMKFLKCSRKNLERFPFNPKMVEMMAESRVFIYPELLPTLAIFQAERGPCRMSPHEDQLIAMGIERFTPFYEDYFSGSQESTSLLICSMISQFMLPHRTAKEIVTRIKSKCLPTSPANPIKYYLENKVAPSSHHVIQPFDRYSTRKLSEIPSYLLPSRWREFFCFSNTVDTLQYQLPEQNISRIPPNTSSETHNSRIALSCPEVRQKRFVPASTSRKLKSSSKYEKIPGKTQMATSVRTRDQRSHKTVSKKRRFVHPHEVEIDLEEIFIENIKCEFDKGENF